MKDIRIHGRRAQGSLVLAQFIAIAAVEDGKFGQTFSPKTGKGRRGDHVQVFVRIDDQAIRLRDPFSCPDYVIVQDSTIHGEVDILEGLKKGGTVLINTEKSLSLPNKESFRWIEVPAYKIAAEVTGKPWMNAALLGAFSAVTKEISFQSVEKAIRKRYYGRLEIQDVEIAWKAYELFRNKT
jgi:pyruvate ferredoxin oxidoreductase gamma subunit